MYGRLHLRSNGERFYLPRSEGGSGVVSIEDCVIDERQNVALYALRNNENLSAQEQALRVNAIKYSIHKTGHTPLCRLCNEKTK